MTLGTDMLKAQAALSASAVVEGLARRASDTFAAQGRLVQAKLERQFKPVAETLEKFHRRQRQRKPGPTGAEVEGGDRAAAGRLDRRFTRRRAGTHAGPDIQGYGWKLSCYSFRPEGTP